jgi:hypothetical protein
MLLPRRIPLLLLLVLAAAMPAAARAQSADSAIVAEARAFMDGYARELAAADREAIAARYDRGGAYLIFDGEREFSEWSVLAERYRTRWMPPVAFEFRDLVFEPVGTAGVVVNGDFYWTVEAGRPPLRFDYTALLVRQEGELRIRLEDEAAHPAPPAR